jgi:hypothetical protein
MVGVIPRFKLKNSRQLATNRMGVLESEGVHLEVY